VVQGETSFVIGGGISRFDAGNINTIDFGIIFRYVLGNFTSLKFDFRNYIFCQVIPKITSPSWQVLHITLGMPPTPQLQRVRTPMSSQKFFALKFHTLFFWSFWGLFMGSATSFADIYDVPKINPIENKTYSLKKELALQVSYLPMDPYIKYFGFGIAYTHFFSDFTGWEVVNADYVAGFDAGLKKTINRQVLVRFQRIFRRCSIMPHLILSSRRFIRKIFCSTHLLFTLQISFVGGAGASSFSTGVVWDSRRGLVLRYFFEQKTSLKFDFKITFFLSSIPNI